MVEILDETRRFAPSDLLRDALERLMAELGLQRRSVTVVLLDDAAMRDHNRRDRGVDAATDVLSYPTGEPDDAGVPTVAHLGDVLVGLDTAVRQAPEHGLDAFQEVLVLAAHGLTHLRGLDHPDEAHWRPFLDAQRRILELAGVAPDDDAAVGLQPSADDPSGPGGAP